MSRTSQLQPDLWLRSAPSSGSLLVLCQRLRRAARSGTQRRDGDCETGAQHPRPGRRSRWGSAAPIRPITSADANPLQSSRPAESGSSSSPARSRVGSARSGICDGLLTLFVRHTSCSLLIQENADPTCARDLDAFLGAWSPPADDRPCAAHPPLEGPDDMPAHIRAALLPTSLTIPVARGRPAARHLAGDISLGASARAAPPRGGGASRLSEQAKAGRSCPRAAGTNYNPPS